MNILLAFTPFLLFAIIDRLAGSLPALAAGAVMAIILVARDAARRRRPKLLEIGTAILFGILALYTIAAHPVWSIIGVRLLVDAGLLVLVLGSMLLRRPFTLAYAREGAPPELSSSPIFIRTNYIITAVWAAAFLVIVLADFIMLSTTGPHGGILLTVLALVGAVKFTGWYPERVRANPPAMRG